MILLFAFLKYKINLLIKKGCDKKRGKCWWEYYSFKTKMKEYKNLSALFFDAWSNKSASVVNFGAELTKIDSSNLIFELDELDKNIFLNYYNKLPIDGDRRFKVKLEFEED